MLGIITTVDIKPSHSERPVDEWWRLNRLIDLK